MKTDNNRDPAMKKTMTAVFTAALLAAAVSTVTAAPMLADRHVAKGVQCTVCHGPDKANPQEPTTATCTACHNVKALVAKTKNVKPVNPHVSPHYQDSLDCTNCHLGHQPSENFCNQCHQFDFKVP